MRAHEAMWFRGEKERRALTAWCGVFTAFGWVMLEGFFELFFGPHVELMRSLAIGSGIGAAAGLFTSSLQWLVVHGHVRNAGALIPATTAGSTIAGLVGGLLLNAVDRHAELYYSSVPLQGAFGAIFVGLATSCAQWVVMREWVVPGYGWNTWLGITAAASIGGTACACAAVAAVTAVLSMTLKSVPWHFVAVVAYLAAAITGGIINGRIITLGLRRVLPDARWLAVSA